MKKSLAICIPTYKRPGTLRRCVDSVVAQIEKCNLSASVHVYVANDASPDDTANAMSAYSSLSYFTGVTRTKNLGMNQNIKHMLREATGISAYQLIITDDDYLQPDALGEIVEFIKREQSEGGGGSPAIWTPRYCYTEDGALHCVVYSPFADTSYVKPSITNAGRYMQNGHVLSGLMVRAECIDYDFWDEYRDNAYFPIIFLGELIREYGARFWNKNVVYHTVLNECHWESWGKNDVVIEVRLLLDYVKAYDVMAARVGGSFDSARFYLSAIPSINYATTGITTSAKLNEPDVFVDAVHDLRASGAIRFSAILRFLMACSLSFCVAKSSAKTLFFRILSIGSVDSKRNGHFKNKSGVWFVALRNALLVLRFIVLPASGKAISNR